MGSQAGISQRHIFLYKELNLKLQGPDKTIFNAWNKIELFKKKPKLWLNTIAE